MNPSLHPLHGDEAVRGELERDLRRRYGAAYDVRARPAAPDVLVALRRDADAGSRVAIVSATRARPAGAPSCSRPSTSCTRSPAGRS